MEYSWKRHDVVRHEPLKHFKIPVIVDPSTGQPKLVKPPMSNYEKYWKDKEQKELERKASMSPRFVPGDIVRCRCLRNDLKIIEVTFVKTEWRYKCEGIGKHVIQPVYYYFENELVLLCKKKQNKLLQEFEDKWRKEDRINWTFDPTLFGFAIAKKTIGDSGIISDWYHRFGNPSKTPWVWNAQKVIDYKPAPDNYYCETCYSFSIERMSRTMYVIKQEISMGKYGNVEKRKKKFVEDIKDELQAFEIFDELEIFEGIPREIDGH
jgi:hypothetical protein